MPRNPTTIETVLARLVTTEEGCWVWPAGRTTKSEGAYGLTKLDGKNWLVHRLVYTHLKGEIPEGLHLDHLCCNRLCANPDHLEPVTPGTNNERRSWLKQHRTRCPHGHRYTPENTRFNKKGSRECVTCLRLKGRRDYEKERQQRIAEGVHQTYVGDRTHCPHGHEYTPENTYVYVKGDYRERQCRECQRRKARAQGKNLTPEQREKRKAYLRDYYQRRKNKDT
jgi:HNH endonuclease